MATKTLEPIEFQFDGATLTLDAAEIREQGWIPEGEASQHCDGACGLCQSAHCDEDTCECDLAEPVMEVLREWHNDNHAGAFRVCYEQLCRDARRAVGE